MRTVRYVRKPESVKELVARKITSASERVYLSSDFNGLGSRDRVQRALGDMVIEGKLVRIGLGVYARARRNPLNGKPMLDVEGGFVAAAQQALTKMGVDWRPSKAVEDYNSGRSTQIPVNAVFRVRGNRKPRKLVYQGREVQYEQIT